MTAPVSLISLACAAVLTTSLSGADYTGPATAPATPTDTISRVPRNAYEDTPAIGAPFKSLFRDTEAPYINSLRGLEASPEMQIAESVEVDGRMDLPDFRGRFPMLQRGFAPEEADLKIGPVYFNLRHLSASALFSDNVDHSENDRESDWIGIVTIGGQLMAQLSEGFRIAVAGNFVYLPSEGEAGFAGFGLRAPYSFGVGASPSAHAQVAWEPVIFGLPVTIADEFTVGLARYSNSAYDGFDLFDGGGFDENAQAGIYTLRGPRYAQGGEFRDRPDQDDFEQTYYSNKISLATGGRLPGGNLFTFNASHTDIWYEDESAEFPSYVDSVRLSVISDRESLRFKPYVSYQLLHRDDPSRISNSILGGVRGPITDLLRLHAAIGYSWISDSDSGGLRWRVGLYHRPGPYTNHQIEYARAESYFLDEVTEYVHYRFHKILGPDLTATAYAGYNWVEDIEGLYPDREEFRTGLRLHYIISPKSSLSLLGQYANIQYDDDVGNTDAWRLRAEYRRRFINKLTARIIYQYQQHSIARPDEDYYENLLYFALSWVFD